MASSKLFIILAIVAAFAPSILAVDYVVGDDAGWTINFNNTKWAEGKEFHVGDKLIFKYTVGLHDVIKITDKSSFDRCAASNESERLTTGHDEIPLETTGQKWYICGVGHHCDNGLKLAITVLAEEPASSPSPSDNLPPPPPSSSSPSPSNNLPPPPPSAATGRIASIYYGFIAVVVAFVGIVMV